MQYLTHDIPCPEDRATAYYLYQNYFHDSDVTDIRPQGADCVLTLQSSRDGDLFWDKCKGTFEERKAQCRAQAELFRYQIIFRKCSYWHCECEDFEFPSTYICGHFLRSALLARVEAKQGKPYYHFRIEMWWKGYLEAVCREFRIRKVAGRIRPQPLKDSSYDEELLAYCPNCALLDGSGQIQEDAVCSLATKEIVYGECLPWQSSFALLWLLRKGHPRALPLSREILSRQDEKIYEETAVSAAHVLGDLGNEEDIPLLLRKYAVSDQPGRRNILDAIEKIQARQPGPK